MGTSLLLLSFLSAIIVNFGHATPIDKRSDSYWSTITCAPVTYTIDDTLISNLSNPNTTDLWTPIRGQYYFSDEEITWSHKSACNTVNDTCIIVATEGGNISLSDVILYKGGYSSDLTQSCFYGLNAAMLVANGTTANLENVNITTHNGAAGVYSYGSGSVVTVDGAQVWTTGPNAHGLYASTEGVIDAYNVDVVTTGWGSSCFSGDSGYGYLTITDSTCRATALGSAIGYAVGNMTFINLWGESLLGPAIAMDANQNATIVDSDVLGGYLGCIVIQSSSVFSLGHVYVTDSILRATGEGQAVFAVGNTEMDLRATRMSVHSESGIFILSNASAIPETFFGWFNEGDPGFALAYLDESLVEGNLLAVNESRIELHLSQYSHLQGAAISEDDGAITIYIDETSAWTLTANSALQGLSTALGSTDHIYSNGFNVT